MVNHYPEVEWQSSNKADASLMAPLEIRESTPIDAVPPVVPPEHLLSPRTSNNVTSTFGQVADLFAESTDQEILDMCKIAAESTNDPAGPDASGFTGSFGFDQHLGQYTPDVLSQGYWNGQYNSHETAVAMELDLEDLGGEEAGHSADWAMHGNNGPHVSRRRSIAGGC
jgi:hypothetical protein